MAANAVRRFRFFPSRSVLRFTALLALLYVAFQAQPCRADDAVSPDVLNAIANDPLLPSYGGGGVTVIEFYDYQCSYCKAAQAGIEQLLQNNGNVRLVLMDYPKLGPLSNEAALVTLAAIRQGADKYTMMHQILMNKDVHLTEAVLFQAAQMAGLDVDRLREDAADPALRQELQGKLAMAQAAGVRVTPSFIVGRHFYPGFADNAKLNEYVAYESRSY